MADLLEFRVNGKIYGGFKNLSITRSVEAISSYFSFDFADTFDAKAGSWPLSPQDQVDIRIDDVPVMKGYIDVLSASLSSAERGYRVEGRDRTSDLVDCILWNTREDYKGMTFTDLCKALTKDFNYRDAGSNEIDPIQFLEGKGNYNRGPLQFSVDRGATVFENLDRAASKAGALLIPTGNGHLRVSVQGDDQSQIDLIEGHNIKTLEFRRDFTKRFSHYTVEGRQKSPKTAEEAEGWFGKAQGSLPQSHMRDINIRRYRPTLITPRGQVTKIDTDAIVGFEVATRMASSLEITVTVAGWTQIPGVPWMINETVKVLAPRLGLGNEYANRFLIAETVYNLSESEGKTTTMRLLPQEAYLNPITVRQSSKDQKGEGKGWNFDEHKGQVKVILPKDVPTKRPNPLKGKK